MDIQPHPEYRKRRYHDLVTLENQEEFEVVSWRRHFNGYSRLQNLGIYLGLVEDPTPPAPFPYSVSVPTYVLLRMERGLHQDAIRGREQPVQAAMRETVYDYLRAKFTAEVSVSEVAAETISEETATVPEEA